jgi:hypothetical protein
MIDFSKIQDIDQYLKYYHAIDFEKCREILDNDRAWEQCQTCPTNVKFIISNTKKWLKENSLKHT